MHRTTLCDPRSPGELAPSPSPAWTSNAPPRAPFFIESQLQGRRPYSRLCRCVPTEPDRAEPPQVKQGAVSVRRAFLPWDCAASRCSLPYVKAFPPARNRCRCSEYRPTLAS